jgi:hypothetical protein
VLSCLIASTIEEVKATPVAERILTTMELLELVDKITESKKMYDAVVETQVFEKMPSLEDLTKRAVDAVNDYERMTRGGNIYRIHSAICQCVAELVNDEDIKNAFEESADTDAKIFESMDDLIDYLKDEISNEDLYHILHNYDLEGYSIYVYDGLGAVETFYEYKDLCENIDPDGFIRWLHRITADSDAQLFENFLGSFDWLADYSKEFVDIWNRFPLTAREYL